MEKGESKLSWAYLCSGHLKKCWNSQNFQEPTFTKFCIKGQWYLVLEERNQISVTVSRFRKMERFLLCSKPCLLRGLLCHESRRKHGINPRFLVILFSSLKFNIGCFVIANKGLCIICRV